MSSAPSPFAVQPTGHKSPALAGTLQFAWKRRRHRIKLALRSWFRPNRGGQPFFVLATYRSGSNLLIDYLRATPNVSSFGEVLLPSVPYGLDRCEYAPEMALRHIRRSLEAQRGPVRGCKLMLDQLADCGLTVDDLRANFPGAKYLILYRESIVEQHVSDLAANATRQWLVRPGEVARRARVTVDPKVLADFCALTRRRYEALLSHAWLRERAVLFSYEELVGDPHRCFVEQIYPLLGLPPQEPRATLRKQNPQALAERITNYEDIAELLASPICRQKHALPADEWAGRAIA
jgi:LPS sulfotransferase NodH